MTPLFERIVVVSGDSNRQVRSLARNVEDKIREAGGEILSTEGEDGGEMGSRRSRGYRCPCYAAGGRAYYNLEELWGGKGPARVRAATSPQA